MRIGVSVSGETEIVESNEDLACCDQCVAVFMFLTCKADPSTRFKAAWAQAQRFEAFLQHEVSAQPQFWPPSPLKPVQQQQQQQQKLQHVTDAAVCVALTHCLCLLHDKQVVSVCPNSLSWQPGLQAAGQHGSAGTAPC